MKVAVSACLVGKNTKYDGKNNYNQKVIDFLADKEYILICPEVFGNLPTPRAPSEQLNDKVINNLGQDVTINFVEGAKKALQMVIDNNVDLLILKAKSPSCGYLKVYDGLFNHTLIDGNGVFVKMALEKGLKILTENDL